VLYNDYTAVYLYVMLDEPCTCPDTTAHKVVFDTAQDDTF